MKLAEVVRLSQPDWVPEAPRKMNLTMDDRYMGSRSVYEVDGDVVQEIRAYVDAQIKTLPSGGPIVSWERILWDEPWEKPKPGQVPLIFVHMFEGIDDFCDPTSPTRGDQYMWLYRVGLHLHKWCSGQGTENARGSMGLHSDIDESWNEFSSNFLRSRVAPSRDQSSFSYVAEVEDAATASVAMKPSWYSFLDTAVLVAQQNLKLPLAPVFVFLFLDFHLSPGGAEAIIRPFRKNGHPRLLCLFGNEPDVRAARQRSAP